MKRLVAAFFAIFSLAAIAQTNIIVVPVGDYTGSSIGTNAMATVTLLSPNPRTVNSIVIRQDPIRSQTRTNSTAYFTNLIWGKYRLEIGPVASGGISTVTPFTFYVGTNTLGTVPIASLITNNAALPPNPATNYYTISQVDALVDGIEGGAGVPLASGTNTTVRTVAGTNYVDVSLDFTNSLASTSYVAAAVASLPTTNYVNDATNGLAGTNYIHPDVPTKSELNPASNGYDITASKLQAWNIPINPLKIPTVDFIGSVSQPIALTKFLGDSASGLSSDGSGMTNIPASGITGLGTAALASTNSFVRTNLVVSESTNASSVTLTANGATFNIRTNGGLSAADQATLNAAVTNTASGLTPMFLSSLIQPGGLVAFGGDSLNVQFVTNRTGFWSGGGTNGYLTCGGTTNANLVANKWFTNGLTLQKENLTVTNESWLMNLTNFIKSEVGWTVPLDNAGCVSGGPLWLFGDMDISDLWVSGYQYWPGIGNYNASGSNTVYAYYGQTNKIVFWGTNEKGTTNDLWVWVPNYGTITNPTPGVTFSTNIFVAGNADSYFACRIGGVPNAPISVDKFLSRPYGNYGIGGTAKRSWLPPYYANSFSNEPLLYLTNIAPVTTGKPKSIFIPFSQNNRLFIMDWRGTNRAAGELNTNFAPVLATYYASLAVKARQLGFWPVVGANIPFNPNCLSGLTYTQVVALNYAISLPSVRTNFDVFYDWAASNSTYKANGSYYIDSTHGAALLNRIEATNVATAFEVPKSASIK